MSNWFQFTLILGISLFGFHAYSAAPTGQIQSITKSGAKVTIAYSVSVTGGLKTLRCKMDSTPYANCSSGKPANNKVVHQVYNNLSGDRHTFRLRIVDRSGADTILTERFRLSELSGEGAASGNTQDSSGSNPRGGKQFIISKAMTSFDCRTRGVRPGDRLVLPGGIRNDLFLKNCKGSESKYITLHNQASSNSAVTIQATRSAVLTGLVCTNCEYFKIDGGVKWRGASKTKRTYGIRVIYKSGRPQNLVRFNGSSSDFTVRNVEIKGSKSMPSGTGFALNDHSYDQKNHPGEWRENILLENLYISQIPRRVRLCGAELGQAEQACKQGCH